MKQVKLKTIHIANYKNIGKLSKVAPEIGGKKVSAELEQAKKDYALKGKEFVINNNRKIYGADGREYALHTKFQTVRTKTGNIKGYNIVDVRFCPTSGKENPFVKVGLQDL